MKKLVWVVLAFALMTGSFAFANDSTEEKKESSVLSLTVEDAVKYALENSKNLKSSAIDLEMAKRSSDYSWNTFLPSASLSGTATRSNEYSYQSAATAPMNRQIYTDLYNLTTSDTGKMTYMGALSHIATDYSSEKDRWSLAGNLGLSWNFSLAMIDSIKIAKSKYENGEITWEQERRNTEANIRKMFYGILLAQENLNIQKESLQNAEDRWKQAEINYKNGMVPRLSMLNTKVTYENKKPAVLSAEQSLKKNKDTFAFLLGLPFGHELELVGSIEFSYVDVDAEKLYADYIEKSYEVLALKKNIETIKLGINATKLATFTPALAVSWNFTPVVIDKETNWFDPDNTFDNGSLSITLAYKNLFDMLPFSANMQSLKDTKQQLAKAELGLEQLYQNIEIEVHSLCANLDVSRENINAMERNVTIAQEAYESTLKAYNAGTQERLELQDSENQLNQAKLGLMNEKFNYISAMLDLETKLNLSLKEIFLENDKQ